MSTDVRAWLPPDTQPPAALQAWLAETVAAWSRHWFVAVRMRLAPLSRAVRGTCAWHALPCGLMIGAGPETGLRVGAWMLDVAADDRAGPDRVLLDAVAAPCLGDLRARLAQRMAAGAPAQWAPVDRLPVWAAAVGNPEAALAIGLTDAAFATLVARVLPSSPAIPLGCGTTALAATRIAVGAAVGRATLHVADLRALEVGDTVVLDRAVADPVPIAVDGHALAGGTVRVVAAAPQPVLEIVQPATPA